MGIPEERSVHDNHLLGYTVDSRRREIRLQTHYSHGGDTPTGEFTDIVFSGVIAYHFEADTFNTILFDVEEAALDKLIEREWALFHDLKKYGWPIPDRFETAEDLTALLQQRGARAFRIDSSLGLDGWVLAERMEILPV